MAEEIKKEKINNITIEFSGIGQGKPVLFLHGNPGTKDDFREVAKIMAPKGFRCILIDRPGHGNSESFPSEFSNPGQAVNLLVECIKKFCGGKSFVVGYSMGAFLALRMATKNPEMIMGLGLVSPFILPRDPSEWPSKIPTFSEIPILKDILKFLVPKLGSGKIQQHIIDCFAPAKPDPAEVAKLTANYSTFQCIVATIKDKNAFLETQSDLMKKLPTIRPPILAIVGDKDAISNGTSHADKICTSQKTAKKEIIGGGGHALPLTHAQKVADLLSGFFP